MVPNPSVLDTAPRATKQRAVSRTGNHRVGRLSVDRGDEHPRASRCEVGEVGDGGLTLG